MAGVNVSAKAVQGEMLHVWTWLWIRPSGLSVYTVWPGKLEGQGGKVVGVAV